MTKPEILKGLTETLFFLAICCYSEDPEQQEKVKRMATSVNEANTMLVDSVALDPLCDFLAEYATPPQSLGLEFTTEKCKAAWKEFIQNNFHR